MFTDEQTDELVVYNYVIMIAADQSFQEAGGGGGGGRGSGFPMKNQKV